MSETLKKTEPQNSALETIRPEQNLLKTVTLTPGEWILVIGMAFAGTFLIEVLKLLRWRNKSNKHH